MRWLLILIGLYLCCPSWHSKSFAQQNVSRDIRWAILVANEQGWKNEPRLRWTTQKDVPLLAGVLRDNGFVVQPALTNQSAGSVRERLRVLMEKARNAKVTSLFFYYSGHSDKNYLHLGPRGSSPLTYAELFSLILKKHIKRNVVIFDSCLSGSALRIYRRSGSARLFAKGQGSALNVFRQISRKSLLDLGISRYGRTFKSFDDFRHWYEEQIPLSLLSKGPPSLARSVAQDPFRPQRPGEGTQIIAAVTKAYQSHKLQGSVFTHFFVEGLRGRADSNQNGVVSLGEAYQYASDQARRFTLQSAQVIQDMDRVSVFQGSFPLALHKQSKILLGRSYAGEVRLHVGNFVLKKVKKAGEALSIDAPAGRVVLTIEKGARSSNSRMCWTHNFWLRAGQTYTLPSLGRATSCARIDSLQKGEAQFEPAFLQAGQTLAALQLPLSQHHLPLFPGSEGSVVDAFLRTPQVREWLELFFRDLVQGSNGASSTYQLLSTLLAWSRSYPRVQEKLYQMLQRKLGLWLVKRKMADKAIFMALALQRIFERAKKQSSNTAFGIFLPRNLEIPKNLVSTRSFDSKAQMEAARQARLAMWSRAAERFALLVRWVKVLGEYIKKDGKKSERYLDAQLLDEKIHQAAFSFARRSNWSLQTWLVAIKTERLLPPEHRDVWRDAVIPALLQKGWRDPVFVGGAAGEAGAYPIALPAEWGKIAAWIKPWLDTKPLQPPSSESLTCTGFFRWSCFGDTKRSAHPVASHPLILRLLRERLFAKPESQEAQAFFAWLTQQALHDPYAAFSAGALLLQVASRLNISLPQLLSSAKKKAGPQNVKTFYARLARRVLRHIVLWSDGTSSWAKQKQMRGIPKAWRLSRKHWAELYRFAVAWDKPILGEKRGIEVLQAFGRQRVMQSWKRFNRHSKQRIKKLRAALKKKQDNWEYYSARYQRALHKGDGDGVVYQLEKRLRLKRQEFLGILARAKRDHVILTRLCQNPLTAPFLAEAMLTSPPKSLEAYVMGQWMLRQAAKSPIALGRILQRVWPQLIAKPMLAVHVFDLWTSFRGRWSSLHTVGVERKSTVRVERESFPENPWSELRSEQEVAAYFWKELLRSAREHVLATTKERETTKVPYHNWLSLFSWFAPPSNHAAHFRKLLSPPGLPTARMKKSQAASNIQRGNGKKEARQKSQSDVLVTMDAAFRSSCRHQWTIAELIHGKMQGETISHPWLHGADYWPPLMEELKKQPVQCEKAFCMRASLSLVAILNQRLMALGLDSRSSRRKELRDVTEDLLLPLRDLGNEKHHGQEGLLAKLHGLSIITGNGHSVASNYLFRGGNLTEFWGIAHELDVWEWELSRLQKGRQLSVDPIPEKEWAVARDIKKRLRRELGLVSALLAHTDSPFSRKAQGQGNAAQLYWKELAGWSAWGRGPGERAPSLLHPGIAPWKIYPKLHHPVSLLEPLLERAVRLDHLTKAMGGPVDVDGFGADFQTPYSWAYLHQSMKEGIHRLKQLETELINSQRHIDTVRAIGSLKPFLAFTMLSRLSMNSSKLFLTQRRSCLSS